MSIIYDALRKTQQYRENHEDSFNSDIMTRDDWIDLGLALVIAFLLGLLIIAHYPKKSAAKSSHQAVITHTQKAVTPTPSNAITAAAKKPEKAIKEMATKISALPRFDDAQYKSKHLVTGIFISENTKVALIDNQFYNIGDTIDGMEIISIEPESVRLKNTQTTLDLRLKV